VVRLVRVNTSKRRSSYLHHQGGPCKEVPLAQFHERAQSLNVFYSSSLDSLQLLERWRGGMTFWIIQQQEITRRRRRRRRLFCNWRLDHFAALLRWWPSSSSSSLCIRNPSTRRCCCSLVIYTFPHILVESFMNPNSSSSSKLNYLHIVSNQTSFIGHSSWCGRFPKYFVYAFNCHCWCCWCCWMSESIESRTTLFTFIHSTEINFMTWHPYVRVRAL